MPRPTCLIFPSTINRSLFFKMPRLLLVQIVAFRTRTVLLSGSKIVSSSIGERAINLSSSGSSFFSFFSSFFFLSWSFFLSIQASFWGSNEFQMPSIHTPLILALGSK